MSSFSSKQAELQMNSCSSRSSTLEAMRVRDPPDREVANIFEFAFVVWGLHISVVRDQEDRAPLETKQTTDDSSSKLTSLQPVALLAHLKCISSAPFWITCHCSDANVYTGLYGLGLTQL